MKETIIISDCDETLPSKEGFDPLWAIEYTGKFITYYMHEDDYEDITKWTK